MIMAEMLHPVLRKYFPTDLQKECELLLKQFETNHIAKGEVLFAEGAEADCLYFVLEGRFAVHKEIGIGKRTQAVALLDSGTFIGEGAIVAERFRGATVLAVEQSTVALLSRQALATIEKNLPELFTGMMKKILSISSLRLQKSSERLALVL